jgi:carboxypeptidase Taq
LRLQLTYPLHIILRYEIEKALFEGTLEVEDIPRVWDDKMEKYLGCKPANYAEGCLQVWPCSRRQALPNFGRKHGV